MAFWEDDVALKSSLFSTYAPSSCTNLCSKRLQSKKAEIVQMEDNIEDEKTVSGHKSQGHYTPSYSLDKIRCKIAPFTSVAS